MTTTKTRKRILLVGFALFGLGACGSSTSAQDFIGMLCDKYASCNMLVPPMSLVFGSSAAECKQKMSSSPQGNLQPDPNKCPNTDVNACFNAYKNLSCADLQGGTTPPECACK